MDDDVFVFFLSIPCWLTYLVSYFWHINSININNDGSQYLHHRWENVYARILYILKFNLHVVFCCYSTKFKNGYIGTVFHPKSDWICNIFCIFKTMCNYYSFNNVYTHLFSELFEDINRFIKHQITNTYNLRIIERFQQTCMVYTVFDSGLLKS